MLHGVNCDHETLSVSSRVDAEGAVRQLLIHATCAKCKAPIEFLGVSEQADPSAPSATSKGVRLPFRAEPIGCNGEPRCKACGRLLYGNELVHTARVDRIECGAVHVVHYEDGRKVEWTP